MLRLLTGTFQLHRILRVLPVAAAMLTLLLLGCDQDPGPQGQAAGAEADAGSRDVDGSDDTSGDADRDAETSDAGEVGDTSDAGPEPDPLAIPEPHLSIEIDPVWAEHAVLGGSVGVACAYRDGRGLLMDEQPDDLEIEVAGFEEVLEDGRYTFAEAGAYEVSCRSESLDLRADDEVVVGFEGVDHTYQDAMRRMGALEPLWRDFFAAIDAEDAEQVESALVELEEAAAGLGELSGDGSLLIEHPGGWPDDADLEQAGLAAGEDDEAWSRALGELIELHQPYREALIGLSLEMTDEELDAVEQPLSQIHLRIAEMDELAPSERAVWGHREQLATLFAQTAETAELQVAVFATLSREEQWEPIVNGSIVGQLGVAAVKIAWDRFGFSPMGWYKDQLRDAGRALAVSAVNLTISGIFNHLIEPLDKAPEIDSVHGSAAGFVCSGVPFTAYGTFHGRYDEHRIFFIPPASIYPVFEFIDLVSQLESQRSSIDDLAEDVNIVNTAMYLNELVKTIEAIASFETPEAFIVKLSPYGGDEQFLDFDALPQGMNPGSFPAAGTMFPLHERYGFGYAHDVNVVQGNCR